MSSHTSEHGDHGEETDDGDHGHKDKTTSAESVSKKAGKEILSKEAKAALAVVPFRLAAEKIQNTVNTAVSVSFQPTAIHRAAEEIDPVRRREKFRELWEQYLREKGQISLLSGLLKASRELEQLHLQQEKIEKHLKTVEASWRSAEKQFGVKLLDAERKPESRPDQEVLKQQLQVIEFAKEAAIRDAMGGLNRHELLSNINSMATGHESDEASLNPLVSFLQSKADVILQIFASHQGETPKLQSIEKFLDDAKKHFESIDPRVAQVCVEPMQNFLMSLLARHRPFASNEVRSLIGTPFTSDDMREAIRNPIAFLRGKNKDASRAFVIFNDGTTSVYNPAMLSRDEQRKLEDLAQQQGIRHISVQKIEDSLRLCETMAEGMMIRGEIMETKQQGVLSRLGRAEPRRKKWIVEIRGKAGREVEVARWLQGKPEKALESTRFPDAIDQVWLRKIFASLDPNWTFSAETKISTVNPVADTKAAEIDSIPSGTLTDHSSPTHHHE